MRLLDWDGEGGFPVLPPSSRVEELARSAPHPLPSPSPLPTLQSSFCLQFFFQNVFESLLSRCPPFTILCVSAPPSDSATPWTAAHQAPLSMGFSRQEYWNGWPFPSPGDLPDPGVEPGSPTTQADSLPFEPPGRPVVCGGVLTPFFCCFSSF